MLSSGPELNCFQSVERGVQPKGTETRSYFPHRERPAATSGVSVAVFVGLAEKSGARRNSLRVCGGLRKPAAPFVQGSRFSFTHLQRNSARVTQPPVVFQNYKALTMRIRKPRTTAVIYESGYVICTGAKRSVARHTSRQSF